jgi:ectoine hydroxylase-related dioxygenase (phytanoyl-CoA dioxygenase family)
MICVLVGIVPPSIESWEIIKKETGTTATINDDDNDNDGNHDHVQGQVSIDWRDYAIIKDEGVPTLVMKAVTELTPEDVMTAVQTILSDKIEGTGTSSTCELWASAPAPLPLQPSIGYENILQWKKEPNDPHDNSSWVDWGAVTLRKWGIIVQEEILNVDQIAELSQYVNTTIVDTDNAIQTNHPEINIGKDVFLFQEIASRNLQRFDLRLTDVDTVNFVETHILGHPDVNALLQCSLGSIAEIDFDISVVYSRPGACVQGWHADGNHQKGSNDAGWTDNGWNTHLSDSYAICMFIPLIDLNDQVGYTQFWPASHRSKNFIGFGPVAEITESTFDGKCNAGDGVWYDYRLLHRGMPNHSDVTRPVLQVIFKKKWYIEKDNYGKEKIAG